MADSLQQLGEYAVRQHSAAIGSMTIAHNELTLHVAREEIVAVMTLSALSF